jgi:8-oxo-dGTP pyrophosphatase MutT (NUDIX family)
MKGKTPAVAAAREAFEETGVRGAIGRAPVGRFTYKKVDRQGASQTIEVEVFLLRVTRQKRDWPERKMRTTKWMLREDAANVVDEGSLKILLRTFNV